MHPYHDRALAAAHRFFSIHNAEHLDKAQVIDRCVEHLSEVFHISHDTASVFATEAYSEFEHPKPQAYVDIDQCTSTAVIVKEVATGNSFYLHVDDLLTLARPTVAR